MWRSMWLSIRLYRYGMLCKNIYQTSPITRKNIQTVAELWIRAYFILQLAVSDGVTWVSNGGRLKQEVNCEREIGRIFFADLNWKDKVQ